MKQILLIIFFLILGTSAFGQDFDYVAKSSTEAQIEYDSSVEMIKDITPTEDDARLQIAKQVKHIIGPSSKKNKTTTSGNYQITNVNIQAIEENHYKIFYHYHGKAIIDNADAENFSIIIPTNPETIYKRSMVKTKNPCTSEHYNSEDDFWYFWNPNRDGCKLIKGIDYQVVPLTVSKIKNTESTYPEYQNLFDEEGNISIHVFFGMDNPTSSLNALKSDDYSAGNYRAFRKYLLTQNFKMTKWTADQIKEIAPNIGDLLPFVETAQKGKIIYRLFFSPTDIKGNVFGFYQFYKNAIEHASILIYGGHSGLGANLNLDSIEEKLGAKINFSLRYQLFYFDGCNSYQYYNDRYFERKKSESDPNGTKTLDIITNGLSTAADTVENSLEVINSAVTKSLNGIFMSYQTLSQKMDSDNYLGINGDEDNSSPLSLNP